MPPKKNHQKPKRQPEKPPDSQPDHKKLYLQEHLKYLRMEMNFIKVRAQIITTELNQTNAELAQHLFETGQ